MGVGATTMSLMQIVGGSFPAMEHDLGQFLGRQEIRIAAEAARVLSDVRRIPDLLAWSCQTAWPAVSLGGGRGQR